MKIYKLVIENGKIVKEEYERKISTELEIIQERDRLIIMFTEDFKNHVNIDKIIRIIRSNGLNSNAVLNVLNIIKRSCFDISFLEYYNNFISRVFKVCLVY
ncbi:MAG: hypothetical protein GXO26_08360 [Crenarchaeota archaeon]|nr:hypothetical protein [Thermoproteota archaeon]